MSYKFSAVSVLAKLTCLPLQKTISATEPFRTHLFNLFNKFLHAFFDEGLEQWTHKRPIVSSNLSHGNEFKFCLYP